MLLPLSLLLFEQLSNDRKVFMRSLISSSIACLVEDFFQKTMIRSSYPEVFFDKDILKIHIKFTWKHSCRSIIWIKLTSAWVFYCKFTAYFQNTFYTKTTSGRLLLHDWSINTTYIKLLPPLLNWIAVLFLNWFM